MTQDLSDVIVIGAGYAGLSCAALLQQAGMRVTLLEAHSTLGGCASFFRKGKFTFDVGATTLSGFEQGQPMYALFKALGLQPNLQPLSHPLTIHLRDSSISKAVHRFANKEQWIEECSITFGAHGQKQFWDTLYNLERKAWQLSTATPYFPFASVSDVAKTIKPSLLSALPLVPKLVTPLQRLLRKQGLDTNTQFVQLLNEQLIISTQSYAKDVPILSAAMGLCYPSAMYYPIGGIYAPALQILRSIQKGGSSVHFRSPVRSLSYHKSSGMWQVETPSQTYSAPIVVSSASIWDMSYLCSDSDTQQYFCERTNKATSPWSALTLALAIPESGLPHVPYHQIHTRETIPFAHSSSIFVTISHPNDTEKSPPGWRTLTVSTHAKAEEWNHCTQQEYSNRKQHIERAIIAELSLVFSSSDFTQAQHIHVGTPHTFKRYTLRHNGFVGGIPHSVHAPLPLLTPNATPFKGLYMIGDSVFPGQGIPAVVLGAMHTAHRITGASFFS